MKKSVKKIVSISASLVIVLTIGLVSFSLIKNSNKLEEIQNEKIQELINNKGQYDEKSIVLSNTNKQKAIEIAESINATVRISSDGKFASLTLPDGVTIMDVFKSDDNLSYLEEMSLDYSVSLSEENNEEESYHLPESPNYSVSDDKYIYQTYLDYLNIQDVWNNYKGSGITIAIIDSGIDIDHPEFAGKISEYSYNASLDKIVKDTLLEDGTYDYSIIDDELGHGTSVAGVIASSMNNEGIVGIASDSKLLVIKADVNSDGSFKRTSDLVFGLYYAIERDVNVVNMSFGTKANVFENATKLAVDSDIICVAAAGNESTSELTYPAADENVIGVGALAMDSWELAYYSNYGENTDVVAPGTVYTTKKKENME